MHFHYSIYILFFVVIMLFSIYIDIRVCVGGVCIYLVAFKYKVHYHYIVYGL